MRSMTGFASDYRNFDNFDILMELKSVNSRYFEFKMKSFSNLDEWENDIKNKISERLRRGKIDLFIKIVEKDAENINVVVNYELAKKYETALVSLSEQLKVVPQITMRDFLNLANIFQTERLGRDETTYDKLMAMLDSMLDKILEMMQIEGQKTKDDIENSLSIIESSLMKIQSVYPESLEKYKQGLKDKMIELFPGDLENQLANNRLLMELEMVSSRVAINEEIVRLKSHIGQFRNILNGKINGDSKKLDFIGQEMNRETNTIASKSTDYLIIENTIEIKGEIENIREQLRNLE